jgi:hypothetical protein
MSGGGVSMMSGTPGLGTSALDGWSNMIGLPDVTRCNVRAAGGHP